MRRIALLIVVLLVVGVSTPTWADGTFMFADDFEGGLSNWTVGPPPNPSQGSPSGMEWSGGHNVVPRNGSHSMHQSSTLDKMYHNLGTELAGTFRASWFIYDSTFEQPFGEVRAYAGSGWGYPYGNDGLQQILAAGRFSGSGPYYAGRVLWDSDYNRVDWFALDAPGAPTRSPGWHRFEIARLPDGTLSWYVDGVLSKTIYNALFVPIDSIAFGTGGWGVLTGDAWFDGVRVTGVVPEPTSAFTIIFGIGGVGGMVWRRRSA